MSNQCSRAGSWAETTLTYRQQFVVIFTCIAIGWLILTVVVPHAGPPVFSVFETETDNRNTNNDIPPHTLLEMCTGNVVTSQNRTSAIFDCYGQIRGFTIAYDSAMSLPSMREQKRDWCFKTDVPVVEVYDRVGDFLLENPNYAVKLIELYGIHSPMTTQNLLRSALHNKFPCKDKQ